MNNPETAALAIGSGGAALLTGQAGPQALLPEEILTVPTAFALGMKAGNAKTNMEIEGGRAYLEMLNNGVSEETARAIATGVGGVNAALDTLQLDELLKAYKILNKAGADDTLLDILVRVVTNRTIDTAVETGQEVLQEGVTIGGTQLGSKMDTGEWAYNLGEVGNSLWDTAKESALTFGLTNIPSTVHNVSVQNHNRLVAAGEANILAGKLPTEEQLQAMNMTEAEALGKIAVLQMGELDDAEHMYSSEVFTNQGINDSAVAIPEEANDIAKQVQENKGTPPKGYKGGRTYNNIPKDAGAQKLPEGVNYKEYDIYPYVKGQNRGVERIVIGDDGSVWYTNDHYQTFTQFK